MPQSYNYKIYSSGRQNFTAGYLLNFQWENDETTWSIPVNEAFERYYGNQSSTRVMTMILHSFSFLNTDEVGNFYLEGQTKVEAFRSFMYNLSDEYTIVSASQLQTYIDNGSVKSEFKLPLRFLEHECDR